MKVSKENNRRTLKVSIAGIVLTLLFPIVNDPFFSALLYVAIEVIYIFLLMYLISILQFLNENYSIQNPFSILLGLEVIKLTGELLFSKQTGNLLMGITIIYIIILIYILVATFKVKSIKLARPFRILGVLWLITSSAKVLLLLMNVKHLAKSDLTLYAGLINVLPLLSIWYIIYKTREIFGVSEPINTQTTQS